MEHPFDWNIDDLDDLDFGCTILDMMGYDFVADQYKNLIEKSDFEADYYYLNNNIFILLNLKSV